MAVMALQENWGTLRSFGKEDAHVVVDNADVLKRIARLLVLQEQPVKC